MASLFEDPRGSRRYVVDVYGFGRIRVGKNKAQAQIILTKINELESSIRNGVPLDPSLKRWLQDAPTKLRNRLVKLGLAKDSSARTVALLLEKFQQTSETKTLRRYAIDNFVEFLGETEVLVSEIDQVDAKRFRLFLEDKENGKGYATATSSRRFKVIRSVFKLAKQLKWIDDNPFEDVVAGPQHNDSKWFFVKAEVFNDVIQHINPELQIAYALGRWGGIRLPSESCLIRLEDISWHPRPSIYIDATKNKPRTIPIFPELRPYLLAAVERAKPGQVYLLPKVREWRDPGQMLTKYLRLAIKKAGYELWPRLLYNLRATRATEVDAEFGSKAESKWIGHGPITAKLHYLGVPDDTFDRATGSISSKSDEIRKPAKGQT